MTAPAPAAASYVAREQDWLFGVCASLARRHQLPLWLVRTIAVILLFSFTWLTALTYFATAMLMSATRPRAQRKLRHWAAWADRILANGMAACRRLFRRRSETKHRRRWSTD